jgi:hypothetical protein
MWAMVSHMHECSRYICDYKNHDHGEIFLLSIDVVAACERLQFVLIYIASHSHGVG